MRIAILEDDIHQAQLLELWLEDAGHKCTLFGAGGAFIQGVGSETFDLLILDWMLPDKSGIEVLEWVRASLGWQIPVLFVTMRESEEDIVLALQKGADDYMVKPVKQHELIARITALGRRTSGTGDVRIGVDLPPYALDPANRSVTLNGKSIEMTHKEFDLAYFLFINIGRVLSRGHILESVWGRNPEVNTRTVDTHISRIRTKLGFNKKLGWHLSAIYQHGYRLEKMDSPVIKQIVH